MPVSHVRRQSNCCFEGLVTSVRPVGCLRRWRCWFQFVQPPDDPQLLVFSPDGSGSAGHYQVTGFSAPVIILVGHI